MSATDATDEELTDPELISRVREGDVGAYGTLFSRHVDAATRLAREQGIWTFPRAAATAAPDVVRLELTVGDATCELAPDQIADIVAAHRPPNNDDAAINLDPAVFATRGSDRRLDLPCGNYFLTADMFVPILFIMAIAVVIQAVTEFLQKRLTPWSNSGSD